MHLGSVAQADKISHHINTLLSFPGGSVVKSLPANAGDPGSIPVSGNPLEKEMTTHSSILAWRIPMDRGAWEATVHGVVSVGHDQVTKPPPSNSLLSKSVKAF